jgi:hypothetical protein
VKEAMTNRADSIVEAICLRCGSPLRTSPSDLGALFRADNERTALENAQTALVRLRGEEFPA